MSKTMDPKDIPAFVNDVVDLGLNICAIGKKHYVIDDSGVQPSDREAVKIGLRSLRERYGEATNLKDEIAAHLHLIRRVIWI